MLGPTSGASFLPVATLDSSPGVAALQPLRPTDSIWLTSLEYRAFLGLQVSSLSRSTTCAARRKCNSHLDCSLLASIGPCIFFLEAICPRSGPFSSRILQGTSTPNLHEIFSQVFKRSPTPCSCRCIRAHFTVSIVRNRTNRKVPPHAVSASTTCLHSPLLFQSCFILQLIIMDISTSVNCFPDESSDKITKS